MPARSPATVGFCLSRNPRSSESYAMVPQALSSVELAPSLPTAMQTFKDCTARSTKPHSVVHVTATTFSSRLQTRKESCSFFARSGTAVSNKFSVVSYSKYTRAHEAPPNPFTRGPSLLQPIHISHFRIPFSPLAGWHVIPLHQHMGIPQLAPWVAQ